MSNELSFRHNETEYTINQGDDAAHVEYVEDATVKRLNQVAYRFRCSGAHIGPTIELLMVNPHDESDEEGGRWFTWDYLVWADDESDVGDIIDDLYTDALRDDLIEIARNWTS